MPAIPCWGVSIPPLIVMTRTPAPVDACDPLLGCVYTPVNCDDQNACTLDACDSLLGCVYTPVNCDDQNACTLDACDSLLGCVYTPVDCDDQNACTLDACDPLLGCVYTSVICEDNNPCTIDKCEEGTCINTSIVCNDGDPCTIDTCVGGQCIFIPVTCDDHNPCTLDSCGPNGCVHTPLVCDDQNACTDDYCDQSGNCVFTARNCDDGDSCTMDLCDPLTGCFYEIIPGCGDPCDGVICDDNQICTIDFCDNGVCVHVCDTNYAHELQWQKSLGGSGDDKAKAVHQTHDGGYIVAGYARSNNGDVSGNHGQSDYWITRLDGAGNLLWAYTYGGSKSESANAIRQTVDGGFIVAGNSKSNDGDVSGNHGGEDFWVIKLDAIGALQWQKSFGGDHADEAYAVQQTMDGGYIVAGYTSSNKFDVSGNHGGSDYWIVRLDAAGNLVWQKALGGSKGEKAYDIRITSDSGYIVAGYSESSNGNVSANNGNKDYWIVKLDATGNLIWEKNYGGSKEDIATSIQPTADGGYVVAGSSKSSDGNVPANNGDEDFWMIRLDSLGNILWSKTYGGSGKDEAYAVVVTDDGGYAIAGGSKSNDGDAAGNHGDSDFWIIRLDAAGTLLWQQMLGGNKNDKAFAMQQTSDGGFVLAGHADSHNNGDVTGHHGSSDFWVVKLAPDRICRPYTELHIVLCPGDSLLIGNTYQGNPGIYMDTLVSAIGCDSIVKITLTQNHCDDGDPCTEDFCVDGNCSYIPLVCNDNDPCTRDTCAGGCRFIPFEEEAGISQMPLPAFCQGDELILKAYPSDAQYFWSTGETTQTITAACGNTYSVTIINANGCQKTDTITTTSCQPHLLLSAHVIVAEREVRLQQNTVYSGGISVNGNYHKAKIEANSVITAPGTFVQADIIQVSGGSTVSIQIPDPAGIALPPFEFNAQCGTQGLHNISVPANSHVILNASVYKNITVGKNSSVTFTEPEINLENLFTQDNVQIHFTQPCVKMKLCKKLQLGKDNTFNPDYKDIMVYVEEDVTIHEGSTIIADIYMKEGKMTVKDAPANDPTVMQGLFIVHFLESGKHVHWYQNIGCPGICHPDITPVLCTANERAVVSFTLVSADDDVDFGPLQDGDTINLSVTGPINIRANVCHGDNIESVAFLVNGSFHRMENLPFYTIAGDNGGNYLPWNVSPGIYTIKAIPYSGNNGTGTMGTPNEITIVIIDGEELCADSDRKITSFTLVNADTDMDIGSLYDGAVIDLSTTGHINVRANVCHSDNVKSVQFFVNGSSYRIENAAPYALAGNSGPNYYIWPVTPGSYTIKAVPYSNFNAGGIAGSDKEVTITIAGSSPKRSDEPALTLQRVADEVEIKAYPNPFTEKLNIEFRLASDSEVKLDILSVDGRFITSVFDGVAKADMLYTFEFLPGNEPPGLLLYRLRTQKGIYYNKVLLVR
ncbi:MAG: hypothetical protein KatS3mg031_0035 [Chitinophagales bacterium]|nr:MAG: hypothetical protein KatS3mg031_0035 [Chitinophagales bacterium]